MGNVLNVLTVGVAALGSISLFVGAVGIATIMTTTVNERSAEIGLLRAIGASQRQILGLFLGEAVLISLLGGVIGLSLLAAIAAVLSLLAPALPLALHPFFLVLALLACAFIGLLAGVIPAYNASRLNPIDALRAE
jgi:putative ABC transport system permease protein